MRGGATVNELTKGRLERDKLAKIVFSVVEARGRISCFELVNLAMPLVPKNIDQYQYTSKADLKSAIWRLHSWGLLDVAPNWDILLRAQEAA